MDFTRFKHSGDLFLPSSIQNILNTYLVGHEHSVFYVNVWSLVHLLSGFILTYAFLYYTAYETHIILQYVLLIHMLWEYWQLLITNTPRTVRGAVDIVTDTIFFLMGYILAIHTYDWHSVHCVDNVTVFGLLRLRRIFGTVIPMLLMTILYVSRHYVHATISLNLFPMDTIQK